VVKVDFIIRKPGEYRALEFSRRRPVDCEGQAIALVAPEDLLLSKLAWAKASRSELQMNDARGLLQVAKLDMDYVRTWAEPLGVANLLREIAP
jgi:hypothetical protein